MSEINKINKNKCSRCNKKRSLIAVHEDRKICQKCKNEICDILALIGKVPNNLRDIEKPIFCESCEDQLLYTEIKNANNDPKIGIEAYRYTDNMGLNSKYIDKYICPSCYKNANEEYNNDNYDNYDPQFDNYYD